MYALADTLAARWRAMVLLAFWCSLRLGELPGLRRRDLDLLHGWVDVHEQIVDIGGALVTGPPKTTAGRRRIAVPPPVREEIAAHLGAWVDEGSDASGAGPLPSATWRRAWGDARRATGLSYRFHDPAARGQHAGGGDRREPIARIRHASTRAALIYEHATSERDQVIAAALAPRFPRPTSCRLPRGMTAGWKPRKRLGNESTGAERPLILVFVVGAAGLEPTTCSL